MRFTDEQLVLQKVVRDFAEKEVEPRMQEILDSPFVPRDLYKRCGELGFFRVLVPKEHGGDGKGLIEATIIHEELSRVCPTFGLTVMCAIPASVAILQAPAVADKYLEAVMNGDCVINGAVTDPAGHTNVSEWPVMAVKDGNEWVLNGTKLYASSAYSGDLHMAYGLDEERNMRVFCFPNDTEGFDHSALYEDKFGMHASGGAAVVYNNVRVPDEMQFKQAVGTSAFYYNLYVVCTAIGLGCAWGLVDKVTEYSKTRTANFEPLISMQYIYQKLARMHTQIECYRTFMYDAASQLDSGDPDMVTHGCLTGQMCKALIPDECFKIVTDAMNIFAGYGFHNEEIFHYYQDVISAGIMDLPTDFQLEGVAGLLGFTS